MDKNNTNKKNLSFRDGRFSNNYDVTFCIIIFNIFEQLKDDFRECPITIVPTIRENGINRNTKIRHS